MRLVAGAGGAPPPRSHYDVLGLGQDATPGDILTAYNQLRRGRFAGPELERAYAVLSDLNLRKMYDVSLRRSEREWVEESLSAARAAAAPAPRSIPRPRLVLALLVGLLLALLLPRWYRASRSFAVGDDLVRHHDRTPLGRVLAYDPAHDFAGRRAPAYQIRLAGEDRVVWLPRDEVRQLADRAPAPAKEAQP